MKKQKNHTLKRLFHFYKPYKGIFALDLLCALLMSAAGLAFPMLVRILLNDVIGASQIIWKTLLTIAGIMVGVKIIECISRYYMITVGHIMGSKIESDIRLSIFEKFLRLPTSFFDNNKVGELLSRSTTDLFDITELAHHGPEKFFIMLVQFIGTFVYLSTINIKLTLILFATIPFFIVVIYYNKKLARIYGQNREQIGEINSHLEDSISGIRVIKSFTGENYEIERARQDNDKFVDIKKKSYMKMGNFSASFTIFSSTLYILTAILGAMYIMKGEINGIDLTTYLLFVSILLNGAENVVQFTEIFQHGISGFRRYCEVVDTPETIKNSPNAKEIENVNGDIEFENVGFSYEDDGRKVLNNINLKVNKGDNVAIVGPSGSGKTTMVNLIPRFYEITNGSIKIDGIDIRDIKLESLRQNIGIVQQDVYLFNGTIAENIAYGNFDATDDAIAKAGKLAGVDEFVKDMPKGYNTFVGERGVRLSGGQKQRISIARIFLKNPPILILDEATSALDNESEKYVQKSLDILAKGRTTLTIAHRLTTIKNAQRILVLTEDGIVEDGTHAELVAKNGIYAGLYKLYQ